ncbi:MAG TPA: benzoate-CoA ligase family protein, partial [Longimicrobium sp.]|nr:benzoate-CoA ligase family protein [Longimicrobium sp.]
MSQAPIPTFPETFNLADYYLFDRISEGLGDKVALRFGDRGYTYASIAERSNVLAQYLLAGRISCEQRVYLVLPDMPAFAWAFFATLRAGAVATLGNPDSPERDLSYVIDYVRARVLVTTPEVAARLADAIQTSPYLEEVLLVPDVPTGGDCEGPVEVPAALVGGRVKVTPLRGALAAGAALPPRRVPETKQGDHAIWLFTSGSTGRPKAAMHSHRDFAFNTEVYAKRTVGYRRDDVTVSVPRLYFGYATGTNLMFPFAVGATAGLFSERPTPEALASAIARYRPTIVTNVPTMMGKLLDHDEARVASGAPRLDFSCVRFHLSAGEALPPPLLERFTARFGNDVYDGIGSAEMFHIYASNRPGDIKPGSLGRPVEGYTLRVLPEEAEGPGGPEVPRGEIGVLWVKGDSVAHGYYQDRQKSWATFHGHWCRTGDLFRIDEDGYLWFCGRADDLLKVSGLWVSPIEVESCLMSHPAVTLAAVIGAEEDGLTKPKAFVVVREGARERLGSDGGRAALAAELQEHVKARLAKHKYPR